MPWSYFFHIFIIFPGAPRVQIIFFSYFYHIFGSSTGPGHIFFIFLIYFRWLRGSRSYFFHMFASSTGPGHISFIFLSYFPGLRGPRSYFYHILFIFWTSQRASVGGGGEPGRNTDILHSSPLHHKIIISFSYFYHFFFIFFTAPRVRGHILFIFFSYYWSYFFHISEIWPKPSRVDGRLGATPAASPEPGVIHCQGLGLGSGRPFSAWAANRFGYKHNGICNQEY